jgi:hypothetical protein
VTWLSTVGTGLISAVICSRMAFRQPGGEEAACRLVRALKLIRAWAFFSHTSFTGGGFRLPA